MVSRGLACGSERHHISMALTDGSPSSSPPATAASTAPGRSRHAGKVLPVQNVLDKTRIFAVSR
jgi:hypothetical protein